ncbi:MAG: hypothetical protein MOIL_01447 [Candidatus Methanolliviera sp. GoM_oil]|nr:MAG: hypothetical protein MOIL_01447 [Candidatus Methanolliviera sp. GoM_oil]
MSKEVISLGTSTKPSPRGNSGRIWREVERNVARCDPNYLLLSNILPEGGDFDREFFALLVDGDHVGRASAAFNKNLEDVGFIEDFMVREDQKDFVDPLIERCLSVLKDKGVKEVMVKGSSLPALQMEGYGEVPPYGCPNNPSWYVDLFERNGFLKTGEWTFFNLKLPEISKDDARKFEETLDHLGIKLRPLKVRDPKDIMAFNDLMYETNAQPYMNINPMRDKKISRFSLFIGSMIMHFRKMKTFVGIDKNGEMVLFMGYFPDFNRAMVPLNAAWKRSLDPQEKGSVLSNLYHSLKVPFAIRRVRTCRELGVGLKVPTHSPSTNYSSSYSEACRDIGVGSAEGASGDIMIADLLNYFIYLIKKDGYKEITAGALISANVRMQDLSNFIGEYAGAIPAFRYASFTYNFKDEEEA